MTLFDLMKKVSALIDEELKKDKINDISKSEVYFFAEDEYQTFDVKIDNIEIEDNKIFLSWGKNESWKIIRDTK